MKKAEKQERDDRESQAPDRDGKQGTYQVGQATGSGIRREEEDNTEEARGEKRASWQSAVRAADADEDNMRKKMRAHAQGRKRSDTGEGQDESGGREESTSKKRKDETEISEDTQMGEQQTTVDREGVDEDAMAIGAIRETGIDIMEMFSPPRVTEYAARFGLRSGEAMDLKTGWDFSRKEHRESAREYIENMKPNLIIGSPECTMFSSLQNLSRWTEDKSRRWTEAKSHMEFMMEIYEKQHLEGGGFYMSTRRRQAHGG